jgi:hypothetical protein
MKISINDTRWITYNSEPDSDSYKGFELQGTMNTKPNAAKLTFTNGVKEITVIENSLEEAFVKVFDMIDSYVANK